MVWYRHLKGPAKYQERVVVEVSEEDARAIKDELTKEYIGEW
jgi:hypothetical protein